MQKYKSHKVVEAAPLAHVDTEQETVGWDTGVVIRKQKVPTGFFARGVPALGDYLVRYEEGYLSWSPKNVFEAGYTPVVEDTPGEHSYRKKPVVIQAFQMTRERRASNANWPAWMHEAWNKDLAEPGSLYPQLNGQGSGGMLCIRTLEGESLVSWGDYIIQGVKGELYPCKPDIFEATYDRLCR